MNYYELSFLGTDATYNVESELEQREFVKNVQRVVGTCAFDNTIILQRPNIIKKLDKKPTGKIYTDWIF
jgi:hypothetical protein